MTRRERHLRIIEWGGEHARRWDEPKMRAKLGLAAYTDEAIEEYASQVVASHRFHEKLRRQNIAAREAREAQHARDI